MYLSLVALKYFLPRNNHIQYNINSVRVKASIFYLNNLGYGWDHEHIILFN